jgi:NADH:ubiquinone reductase (non-electrogenic)
VFSIGDCSGFVESIGRLTLPALAQVCHVSFITFFSFLKLLHFGVSVIYIYAIVPKIILIAQVEERQGKYLAGLLNTIGKAGGGRANNMKEIKLGDPFVYKHLGSMATIGTYKALVDLRQSKVNINNLLKCPFYSS